ncbi:MAG: hypothetical protein SF162_17660 [bacterium]|nr:hypothetical protein [bacterium]
MFGQGQNPQEHFRLILITVVGQAFGAAGYVLEERPPQWAGGQYRFYKDLGGGLNGFIEFMHLYYAEGKPSRFRVTLTRTDQAVPNTSSAHPQYVQRSLSALVVEDFGVAILPSADHWWTYRNGDTRELGQGLGEAGSLIIGYGIPWLAGELRPT